TPSAAGHRRRVGAACTPGTPCVAGHRQRAGAASTPSTPSVARPATQAPTASGAVPTTFIHGGLTSWNQAGATTASATDHGCGTERPAPASTAPNSSPTQPTRISTPYQV